MKKKVLITSFIVILILIIGIYMLRNYYIYNVYDTHQVKKEAINFFNGKFSNKIWDKSLEGYDRLKTPIEDLNHYDITKIVDKYIELVMLRKNNNGLEDKKKIHDSRISDMRKYEKEGPFKYGKDIEMRYDNNIQYYIVNVDKNYTKEKLISELKNILEYEEVDGKIKWMINDIKEKVIELPFNCYFKYVPYNREDNTEFIEVVDIEFADNFDPNRDGNNIIVKYKIKNGDIRTKLTYGDKIIENKKIYYSFSPATILTLNGEHPATLSLRNHDIDRIEEEDNKMREEKANKFYQQEMEAGLR